jgi:hypothetical protein
MEPPQPFSGVTGRRNIATAEEGERWAREVQAGCSKATLFNLTMDGTEPIGRQ